MRKTSLVAVYGTLRRGEYRGDMLESSKYLGTFRTDPNLWTMWNVNGAFPVVCRIADTPFETKSESLWYELFEVDQYVLRELDHIEGIRDGLFERIEIPTKYGPAFMYIAGKRFIDSVNDGHYHRIVTNDWSDRLTV